MTIRCIMLLTTSSFLCLQAENNNLRTNHPAVLVTINAQTQSGLQQPNTLQQQAEHKSEQATTIQTNVHTQQEQKDAPYVKPQATSSLTSYSIRNGAKFYAVYLIAGATQPWLFPVFLGVRALYALTSDTPWIDSATPQEQQELAKEGKFQRSEPIVFPIAHELYKACTKK